MLLSRAAAAKHLGVSVAAFDRHVRGGGGLPEIKIGRLPRFRLEDLEAWAAGTTAAPPSQQPGTVPPESAPPRPRLGDEERRAVRKLLTRSQRVALGVATASEIESEQRFAERRKAGFGYPDAK